MPDVLSLLAERYTQASPRLKAAPEKTRQSVHAQRLELVALPLLVAPNAPRVHPARMPSSIVAG